jgi:hypothetical protein
MPIPSKKDNEKKSEFMTRCMSDPVMTKEYSDPKQRIAICLGKTKSEAEESNILQQVSENIEYINYLESFGYTEDLTEENLYIPKEEEYVLELADNPIEEYVFSKFQYKDLITNEVFTYDRKGVYTKNGRTLKYVGLASEYQGRKVTLNKPFRTPDGPKKFSVYVKNEKGNVVKVNFGDPNMKIKKNIPERRKSFRARHNCDNPGPKWKARYWSCKAW